MNINQKNSSTSLRKIRVWFALILFLSLFAYPTPVLACSCAESSSPAAEFTQADAVFSGEVTQVREISSGYRVYFAVTRSWKSISTSAAELTTGYGEGDCGYFFEVGETYVVYAYGMPNDLSTGICTRTSEVSRAAEDLSYLDTLQPLFLVSTSQPSWRQIDTISLIVAGSLLFFATIWLLHRQRRAPL